MPQHRHRSPAIVALITAALIAAGCGGDGDGETTAATTPPPVATATERPDSPTPPTGDGRGGVRLTEIAEFESPVHVAQPPGAGELYVVEQSGTIRVIDASGGVRPEPFLDIRDQVVAGGEQGLLSIAFAPDYEQSGRFYVDYTDSNGDTRVVEYRRSQGDPLQADPDSARELLAVDQPFENHNGGLLLFGPDGQLYVGLGDGGSAGDPQRNGQNLDALLGKILRIDPQPSDKRPYSVPDDNPFVGQEGARPEIYSYGLRNPWRFSFDRETGDLAIGDVGQSALEEVDYVAEGDGAGANFGWSAFEGTERYNEDQRAPGHVPPILVYGRDRGCSVTGGYVVRDRNLPSLYGRYLYADYCAGRLRSLVPSPSGARGDRELGLELPFPSSFGEDSSGRLYVTSLEGPVYRLDPG